VNIKLTLGLENQRTAVIGCHLKLIKCVIEND
jgi:hypothetical protein